MTDSIAINACNDVRNYNGQYDGDVGYFYEVMYYTCICQVIENIWGTGHWQYTKFCTDDVLAGTTDGYMISDCDTIDGITYQGYECNCLTRRYPQDVAINPVTGITNYNDIQGVEEFTVDWW